MLANHKTEHMEFLDIDTLDPIADCSNKNYYLEEAPEKRFDVNCLFRTQLQLRISSPFCACYPCAGRGPNGFWK